MGIENRMVQTETIFTVGKALSMYEWNVMGCKLTVMSYRACMDCNSLRYSLIISNYVIHFFDTPIYIYIYKPGTKSVLQRGEINEQ